ncbi:MAG: TIGR03546 family protein [Candidatus Latescibacteria bacterium]|nr:TIGR03546 family protein [Candidatus Latescibacterota bacterium]
MPLLALIQKLIKTLNSEGTPNQIAAGIAIGAVVGLTPLMSLHNLALIALAIITCVSIPGVMLGWMLFVPVGFLLDPQFHEIGRWLLLQPSLAPIWTAGYNTPIIALTSFNNTVVLGSFVGWTVLAVPIFFTARIGVIKYREHLYDRLAKTKLFKAVKTSKLYKLYRLFRPE